MAKRYELSDAARTDQDLVPELKMGRPRSDDRLTLNSILWVALRCRLARSSGALRPMVDRVSALS